MTSTTASRRPIGHEPPAVVRHLFLAILALWVIIPIGLRGAVAQDAVPYLAAGELVRAHPDEVYAAVDGDLYELRPTYREAWCDVAPRGTDCDDLATAYVSSPMLLVPSIGLAALGGDSGALVLRFAASLMLAAGMWQLWRLLAHRTERSATILAITAVVLTPTAMVPITLGQTAPIMFLSVCLGMGGDRRRRVASALAWFGASAVKVVPAALGLVVVARRRWSMLGVALGAAVLALVVTLVVVPPSLWGDAIATTLEMSRHAADNPYNGSLQAMVARVLPGGAGSGAGRVAATTVALAAGAATCAFGMRRVDDDTRWAVSWVAVLLVTPLVWWHYVWVGFGALGLVLARQRALSDQLVMVLPASALVMAAPSIAFARGATAPVAQALVLLALIGAVLALTERQRRSTGLARNTPG